MSAKFRIRAFGASLRFGTRSRAAGSHPGDGPAGAGINGGALGSRRRPTSYFMISMTGSPKFSKAGSMPRPGLSDTAILPFLRTGAPDAVRTVT